MKSATINRGAFRLFRLVGIDVYLHWSWFLVAAFMIYYRGHSYHSFAWNIVEYLTLFVLVLLHEFGHALACRSVGGHSDEIMLWPLGGVAFVDPPQRPGTTLWSIAAGPLVNVILAPVLLALWPANILGLPTTGSDLYEYLKAISAINIILFVFNILPVYPLDGGQIFRSLLWFVFGRARSLQIASIVGFVGAGLMMLLALNLRDTWLIVLAVFILMLCVQGFQQAQALARLDKMPHRAGFACPSCGIAPLIGAFWRCNRCRTVFDTFESGSACPQCGATFEVTRCPQCGAKAPMPAWRTTPPTPGSQRPVA